MRSQSVLVLAAAVFLGLIAVLIANFVLEDEAPTAASGQPAATATTEVVVAKVPLEFGATVAPQQLKTVQWPAEAVPPGAFRTVAEVTDGEPRVALRAMEVNEPVLASKVSGKGGRLSMSGLIGKDMRAATIRVNEIVGVGGFLLPGDRVDVMITRTLSGQETPITDVLLQNVKVVAVAQDANEARSQPAVVSSVTLEVTPVQAQKLILGEQVGTLSLTLRNLTNEVPERARTVRANDLRYGSDGVAIASTARPVRRYVQRERRPVRQATETVQVVRGTQGSNYQVRAIGS